MLYWFRSGDFDMNAKDRRGLPKTFEYNDFEIIVTHLRGTLASYIHICIHEYIHTYIHTYIIVHLVRIKT